MLQIVLRYLVKDPEAMLDVILSSQQKEHMPKNEKILANRKMIVLQQKVNKYH